ncbi:MAG: SDR family NAD(P)-dependent oxidoreductase [Polyangiaceae bacterium]|nr:SDR family NAD(P)-dependent oxidoreductase [Polyangiaceae bacterium]
MRSQFTDSSIPDQRGRTVVVTGGNSGIGFEAAVAFAKRGASAILACRDPKRAEGALAELARRVPGASARALRLDLADLGSVRDFAAELGATTERLDLLVNNAGIMGLPKSATKDGFESHLGTNHFGHFALTMRLLPLLERAETPRVVTVSSMTHTSGSIDFDDIDRDRSYSASAAYTGSKLANLLFALELERRLRRSGARALSVACHPGWAGTQITKSTPLARRAKWVAGVLEWGNAFVGQPAHMGAWPTLYSAVMPIEGGAYVGPSALFGTRGHPAVQTPSRTARDEKAAKRLWAISEERTGLRFPG